MEIKTVLMNVVLITIRVMTCRSRHNSFVSSTTHSGHDTILGLYAGPGTTHGMHQVCSSIDTNHDMSHDIGDTSVTYHGSRLKPMPSHNTSPPFIVLYHKEQYSHNEEHITTKFKQLSPKKD